MAEEAENANLTESGSPWPVKSRGCTDCYCVLVYIFGWVVFVAVTLAGLQDGNPTKLYAPRDYSGSYCGVDSNWQTGYDLNGFSSLGFTMNVTSTTDMIVKELICSNAARDALMGLLTTTEAQQEYLCTCCLSACSRCTGAYKVQKLDSSNVQEIISGKMSEFQGSASTLFNAKGMNGDYFTEIWSEAAKYFNMVCLPDCTVTYNSLNTTYRTWTYTMAADDPFQPYWSLLNTSGPAVIKDTITNSFTFKAFPTSICPYAASKCVPMPGVEFSEIMPGYCSLEVSELVDGVMAEALESMSADAFQTEFEGLTSFGTLFGEALKTADTFACVAVTCVVIALLYMVLLRFLVGTCVWLALFAVLVLFLFGGGLLIARSSQCQGAELFDTGFQMAVATTTYLASSATNAVNQAVDPNSYEVLSEELLGDGGNGNYTGAQTRTVDGYSCINWGTNGTDAENYTQAAYPNSNLTENYCRNPYLTGASADTKAATIWCFTSDSEVTWQECQPIGVLRPACRNGFAVPDETVRQILEYAAYTSWVIGALYLFLILCFCSRIREAIAINKVAAIFVAGNPTLLLVPLIQAVLAVLWVGSWVFFASFLLSQVPEDYTPSGTFATYAEAYGTATTPGQCTDKWPTGFTYKDDDNCEIVNGTAQCWRCAQPRYAFDYRFAASFFMLLWNNAFNIACGQFIVAGAAAAWFFTPNSEKGRRGSTRQAVWWAVRYHLGSLAFGSFIIAVVAFIRYCLLYLQKQAEAQKNRAVIVEKATQARQDNLEEKVRQKALERERNMIELALLCDRMDLDASGTLSVEEMILGYEQEPKMHAVMTECGMEKSDLQTLFNAMDADGSGEVDYVEFCSELGKFYKRDPLVLASMTRHSQAELKKIVEQEVMMALREQTQMMHDQLDLLCKIPGLEKAGGKVKQKWQATSRVSKPPLRLSFSQSSLDGQTGFSSRQISRDGASLAELQAEIDRLLAFSKRLQPTEPVIDLDPPTAERLSEAESSKGGQDATMSVTASDFLRQRVGSGESGGGMTPAARRRQQWTHLDRKLQEVSLRFQNQIVHEELMRQRCQEIINHLNETVQENLMVSQQM